MFAYNFVPRLFPRKALQNLAPQNLAPKTIPGYDPVSTVQTNVGGVRAPGDLWLQETYFGKKKSIDDEALYFLFIIVIPGGSSGGMLPREILKNQTVGEDKVVQDRNILQYYKITSTLICQMDFE